MGSSDILIYISYAVAKMVSVSRTAQPVVVPAVANPAAASMDADTTPAVAKADKAHK